MEIFVEDQAYNPQFPITSDRKRWYKESEEGQRSMCEIMERIAAEERRARRKEGRKEGETRINRLNTILIESNRFEDLKRAAQDHAYQTKLMLELLSEKRCIHSKIMFD